MHDPNLVTLLVGLVTRSAVWILLGLTALRAMRYLRADHNRYVGAAFITAGCLLTTISATLRVLADAHYISPSSGLFGYASTVSTAILATGILLLLIRGVEHVTGREWRPWKR